MEDPKEYRFCKLCGFMEIQPVEDEYCPTCNAIKVKHPDIFRHILAVHEYSWDSGVHDAVRQS